MSRVRFIFGLAVLGAAFCVAILARAGNNAQVTPTERTFHESKTAVEKALKKLQPTMSGRLPALEGFALVGEHPLTRYRRAFYQCSAQVAATPSGGSAVRITAKVTAWYSDPASAHSGYELLTSNGRLESDLLDQLSDLLGGASVDVGNSGSSAPAAAATQQSVNEEAVPSAPVPRSESGSFAASTGGSLSAQELAAQNPRRETPGAKGASEVQSAAAALEDVLKNQMHPKNLVAIKKSGTPVVASPSLTAKTLFLASAHDEFELLDFNGDWVHVRISGLSRGWIWRTSLEMPESIPDVPKPAAAALTAVDMFEVSREETAQFPGDWGPLRGKNVKIISVQKIRESEQAGGASAKLEFAKSLLDRSYEEIAKSGSLSGLVLIFDSADGGMIAATLPTMQKWKAGTLSDAAMWHQCYFDPPETFAVSSAAGSR
ncbi:MAG: hypothetical protein WAL71_00680 [Terriglobales bacterium]|jgi:hypothetical protein